ncbi:hypothetical protein HMPREF0277_1922, partial [Corynebacterium accolens ATCC 49726]
GYSPWEEARGEKDGGAGSSCATGTCWGKGVYKRAGDPADWS